MMTLKPGSRVPPTAFKLKAPSPVVVFDSGVGGLAVLQTLITERPDLRYLYVADTAWMPYGSKDTALISHRLELLQRMIQDETQAKQWVLACNTASSSLPQLYEETAAEEDTLNEFEKRGLFDKRWLGILKPTTQAAIAWAKQAQQQANHQAPPVRVALLATESTVKSQRYEGLFAQAPRGLLHFKSFACPGLAEAVEGRDSEPYETLLPRLLAPVLAWEPQLLILACTHYLHIEALITVYLPLGITVLNPAKAVVQALQPLLPKPSSVKPKRFPAQWLRVWVTHNPQAFQQQVACLPLKGLPPFQTELFEA